MSTLAILIANGDTLAVLIQQLWGVGACETAVRGGGDPCRLDLGVLGDGALMHLVDGGFPQGQPAREMRRSQGGLVMHTPVCVKGVSVVEPGAEQHGRQKSHIT